VLHDRDPVALARSASVERLEVRETDLGREEAVKEAAAAADLVIGSVPGHLGFRTARAVIEAGRSLVDISFFPEDPFILDGEARARGVTAVVDCGVMPGLGGMLGLHLAEGLERPERLTIFVGGLPVERRWPMEYKAPFSPIDVIEEYVRPARFRHRGEEVVLPALSEPELVDIPGVGTLEAFNTDGLRTLLRTCDIPELREKTLRYPGHVEKMRMLRDLGFFSTEPLELEGVQVRPLDVTASLLFGAWRLEPGMPELTVMRVEVTGREAGRRVVRRADLLDRTDPGTGDTSMARTTGLPAVVVARGLAEGAAMPTGVVPAERIARDRPTFDLLIAELRRRGVGLSFETVPAPGPARQEPR
jgi:lysine 6-dehydrogenase